LIVGRLLALVVLVACLRLNVGLVVRWTLLVCGWLVGFGLRCWLVGCPLLVAGWFDVVGLVTLVWTLV